jgi:hypothetical protein
MILNSGRNLIWLKGEYYFASKVFFLYSAKNVTISVIFWNHGKYRTTSLYL